MSKKNIIRVVVAVLLIAVIFIASRESAITVSDQSVKFGGMYGKTISIDEITKVELRENLPEVHRRVNGIGILGLRKGIFNLDEFERARLLLHSNSGPYIIIQSSDEVIIVNFRDSQRTNTEYEKLSSLAD